MCVTARRERLHNRQFFKNRDDYTYAMVFEISGITLFTIYPFLLVTLLIDALRDRPDKDIGFMTCLLLVAISYSIFVLAMVAVTCCWLPDRCFRPCALLAISQILLILFIIFHPYQTFVPGPTTATFVDVFKISYNAAFIWIPLLIISLLSCAIISWKASDQSEVYTVVYDGDRSSTKKLDV